MTQLHSCFGGTSESVAKADPSLSFSKAVAFPIHQAISSLVMCSQTLICQSLTFCVHFCSKGDGVYFSKVDTHLVWVSSIAAEMQTMEATTKTAQRYFTTIFINSQFSSVTALGLSLEIGSRVPGLQSSSHPQTREG
jgi:hypothetical protein